MRMSSGVAMATSATARSLPNVLYAQLRMDRMNLTAASPLFATSTLRAGTPQLLKAQGSGLDRAGELEGTHSL